MPLSVVLLFSLEAPTGSRWTFEELVDVYSRALEFCKMTDVPVTAVSYDSFGVHVHQMSGAGDLEWKVVSGMKTDLSISKDFRHELNVVPTDSSIKMWTASHKAPVTSETAARTVVELAVEAALYYALIQAMRVQDCHVVHFVQSHERMSMASLEEFDDRIGSKIGAVAARARSFAVHSVLMLDDVDTTVFEGSKCYASRCPDALHGVQSSVGDTQFLRVMEQVAGVDRVPSYVLSDLSSPVALRVVQMAWAALARKFVETYGLLGDTSSDITTLSDTEMARWTLNGTDSPFCSKGYFFPPAIETPDQVTIWKEPASSTDAAAASTDAVADAAADAAPAHEFVLELQWTKHKQLFSVPYLLFVDMGINPCVSTGIWEIMDRVSMSRLSGTKASAGMRFYGTVLMHQLLSIVSASASSTLTTDTSSTLTTDTSSSTSSTSSTIDAKLVVSFAHSLDTTFVKHAHMSLESGLVSDADFDAPFMGLVFAVFVDLARFMQIRGIARQDWILKFTKDKEYELVGKTSIMPNTIAIEMLQSKPDLYKLNEDRIDRLKALISAKPHLYRDRSKYVADDIMKIVPTTLLREKLARNVKMAIRSRKVTVDRGKEDGLDGASALDKAEIDKTVNAAAEKYVTTSFVGCHIAYDLDVSRLQLRDLDVADDKIESHLSSHWGVTAPVSAKQWKAKLAECREIVRREFVKWNVN